MITAIKDLKHIRIIIIPAPGWLKQTGNEMGINVFLLNVNGTRFSTGSLRHNNCAPAEEGESREQHYWPQLSLSSNSNWYWLAWQLTNSFLPPAMGFVIAFAMSRRMIHDGPALNMSHQSSNQSNTRDTGWVCAWQGLSMTTTWIFVTWVVRQEKLSWLYKCTIVRDRES